MRCALSTATTSRRCPPGANWLMAAIADEAERWLGKPFCCHQHRDHWHALRTMGIEDKVEGYTRLMREL